MLSLRSTGKIVGSSTSIRELARQHNLSPPISLRELLKALGARGSPIKHVFVLMLENRSFDHMLGFSGITGTDATTGQPTTIEGLKGTESNNFEGPHTVSMGATDVMSHDPGHNFRAVLEQLCGEEAVYPSGGPYPTIKNSGFVSSYAKQAGAESAGDIMKCFSPSQLPVLNALAREFVVCDHWFFPIPGPTEPNRMFAHAATCGAWCSPGVLGFPCFLKLNHPVRSIASVLM